VTVRTQKRERTNDMDACIDHGVLRPASGVLLTVGGDGHVEGSTFNRRGSGPGGVCGWGWGLEWFVSASYRGHYCTFRGNDNTETLGGVWGGHRIRLPSVAAASHDQLAHCPYAYRHIST